MMYRMRFIRIFFKALFFPPKDRQQLESITVFRALPTDVDVSRLFTQSFIAFTALARWQWVVEHWNLKKVWTDRLLPVTAVELVRYRFPIKLFQKFRVRTTPIFWDEKAVYLEQLFETERGVAAVALVKGIMKGARGEPKSWEALTIPHVPPSVHPPDVVSQWEQMSKWFRRM